MIALKSSYETLTSLFRGSQSRARSLRGTVLITGSFGIAKAMQLGSNLILTRILFPEAFGLMVLVTVFIGGLRMISDVGIGPSITRSIRGEDPDFLATAWTLTVVRGLWITVLAWLLAYPYARLYDQDILFPLICVSALSAAVSGFRSIEGSVRARNIDLGTVIALDLVGQTLTIALTVLFAWWTQSVWGLAIGTTVGAVVQTLLSLIFLPSNDNRFKWDRSILSEILLFGRWILLGTLFTYMSGQGLKAINGYLVDLDTLAFLHIAGLLGWMLGELTGKILQSVGYPVLSRVVRERPLEIRAMALKIRVLQTAFTTPAFILLALVAHPLIGLIYDDRYAIAGTFLSIIALNGAIGVLPMVYQSVMLASGESRVHAFVMGVSSALKIGSTIAGFYLGGPVGMIVGLGASEFLVFLLSYSLARRRGFSSPRLDAANLVLIALAYAYVLQTIDWTI